MNRKEEQSTRERAVLRAAELYFLDGLTQSAIAERLGCTRWTVGRLLKEGEESGIVDIRIRHPQARQHDLELALRDRYKLEDAQVVASQEREGESLALVARTAAYYISQIRPRPRSIAVGWGRTLAAISKAVATNWAPGVTVIQASSSPQVVDEVLGSGLARLLARKAPGRAMLLSSSMHEHSRSTDSFGNSDADILERAERADVVLYSPGGIRDSSILVRSGFIKSDELKRLWQIGARGNVMSRLIDKDGRIVCPELDARTPSISLKALRKARLTIAVGIGEGKVEAFDALLNGGLADVIITDSRMAQALLE